MVATIVAAVLAVLELLEMWGGWSFGIGEEWVQAILVVLTPILVWLVPGWVAPHQRSPNPRTP